MRRFGMVAAAVFGLAVPGLAISGVARAEIHPRVRELTARFSSATVAQRYVLVRDLWQSWESADPAQVEGALSAIAADPKENPSVVAYAGLMEAYARRRRGDLAGSRRRIASLGYVSDWLIVGPFENDNKSGLSRVNVPERELGEPIVFDRSYEGKARTVHWRRSPAIHPFGYVDLGAMVRPQRDVCVYATTYVRGKPRDIALYTGATGAYQLFWNDTKVLTDSSYRVVDSDRHAVVVSLKEGFQRITAKVCADEAPPMLSLRIAETDGRPAKGLEIATSEQASTDAAGRMRRAPAGKANKPSAKAIGSVQRFEQALKAKPDDPQLQADYAHFLARTGADPENSHRARDLARRAADAKPNVERLLLAAELSADKNDKRELIERAEKLPDAGKRRVELLLARASLLRGGPGWREAFPLYDEVLQLQPTNVLALLGKTDLYVEAGLKRTALSTLKAASERQPTSVALRRALAGQLRALGRAVEAHEAEARYAALRFDDAGYLSEQLRLAAARRDAKGTKRWAKRLIAHEPASLWAHGRVAQAQLALGDSKAASASYRRALAIAPEDIGTLQSLSELQGMMGKRAEQVATLKKVLRLAPQAKNVRAYLEHVAPTTARDDEKYAWSSAQLLAKRTLKDDRHDRRTLRQLEVTTVYDNGLASHFHQDAFQPLTKEAAERSRTHVFYYHADRQVVHLRGARVLRKDGRIDEAIESGESAVNDPTINMYTSQRAYIVRFPRLEPGDVVEVRYRIEDVAARNEIADYFGEVVHMQSLEPIASAEYVLVAPKSKKLHITHAAIAGLKKTEEVRGKQRIYRFVANDVAPIEVEPGMPPLSELLGHVHVSTFASWEDVGRWYWTLARDKVDADDDVRKLVRKLVKGLSTNREKVAAIYHYVGSETRYVALELGIEGIRPRSAALTLARGWGDCKDKATLIVSMLRELGIKSEIVLVRTGLRGDFDTRTASLAPFDHAIAYVPELDLYLDGTAEITGTGELPVMDRAAVGLRISEGEGKLVRLPQLGPQQSRSSHNLSLKLGTDGRIDFEAKVQRAGASAPSWRQRLLPKATRRDRISADVASDLGGVTLLPGVRGAKVSDLSALEQPVVFEARGSASATERKNNWVLHSGPRWGLVAGYASKPKRDHELLVSFLREREDVWTLSLAPGMRVVDVPKNMKLSTSFGEFEVEVTRKGSGVVVRSLLRLKKARIKPSEYAAWRKFCQQVDAHSDGDIVVAR